MGITCHAVVDSVWSGFDTPIGASGTETITIMAEDLETDSTVSLNVTALVQPLAARLEDNLGFVVKTSNEIFDLDFLRFWSQSCPDTALRPSLEIDYTLPPAVPYSEVDQP
jgi:hypothetical protein